MNLKSIFLIVFIIGQLLTAQTSSIAVLEMESNGLSQDAVKSLTANLISELGQSRKISLVERTRLNSVMQELGLISSGLTAETDSLSKIGKMTGADLVLLSYIGKVGSVYSINLRLVNVVTAKNEQSVTVSDDCDRSDLYLLVRQASRDLLYKLTGEEFASFSKGGIVGRSSLFPGWGQFYSGRYVRGSVYSAAFIASLTMCYLSWQNYQEQNDNYEDLTSKLNQESDIFNKVALAEDMNKVRKEMQKYSDDNAMYAYTAAGVYLFSLFDAILTDSDNPTYRYYSFEPVINKNPNLQTGIKLSFNF